MLNVSYIRDRIIPALQSGDYVQGQSRLRTGNAFCCLGVMEDCLITDALIHREWTHDEGTGWVSIELGDDASDVWIGPGRLSLSTAARDALGFDGYEGEVETGEDEHGCTTNFIYAPDPDYAPRNFFTLSMLNDQLRWDFPQIADALTRLCDSVEAQFTIKEN